MRNATMRRKNGKRVRKMSELFREERAKRHILMGMLLQKERDLELAAKIGQSLLEQNRELQTRNDYLEESLSVTKESVGQLRYELRCRAKLLQNYAAEEDDPESTCVREKRIKIENLEKQIRKLESENESLKLETSNLKKLSAGLEEKERLQVMEWTHQLDLANDKIHRLQAQIVEKGDEMTSQNNEIERLVKELTAEQMHEKKLVAEKSELIDQLNDAIGLQEDLAKQVAELQERYVEVVDMLHDAEEELKLFRQNHSSYHRTSSTDSLYDSLASELEASDSGFYSTISSARSDPRQSFGDIQKPDINKLHVELQRIQPEETIKESPSMEQIEVETRSVATATDQFASRSRQISHNSDDVIDVPSVALAELVRRSKSLDRQRARFLRCEPASATPASFNDSRYVASANRFLPKASCEFPDCRNDSMEVSARNADKTLSKSIPIGGSVDDGILNGRISAAVEEKSLFLPIPTSQSFPSAYAPFSSCSRRPVAGTLSQSTSSDSLADYEGPQMGEPGRPGTRDLIYSMRRLNIRKKVEKDYARYREQRGLAPAQTSFSINTTLFSPLPKATPVGLLAAVANGASQGVLTRSSLPQSSSYSTSSSSQHPKRYVIGVNAYCSVFPGTRPAGITEALAVGCQPCEASSLRMSHGPHLVLPRGNDGSPAGASISLDRIKSGIITRAGLP